MADIFISYTSSDKAWAFWLGKELEALGHTPHIHEWEIAAGADIYAWMERTHHGADHVLCVVSDDYLDHLKAPFSALERNAALWQAASKRPRFALFVVVKACKLPTLTDHLRRCEVHDVPEAVARERFKAYMTTPAVPEAAAFPGKGVAVSNIPINVPLHFMGRDEPLAAIAAALARYEGRVAITALHGLRGVGKTTLAAAYAERHAADYRATWWIRAQTEATMRADMVALGVRLGWVEPDAKEEPALATVAERLRHEGEGILLIYDNAIDAGSLKLYLPRGGGARVLVTSNAPTWRGLAEPVEIRLWPAQVGADYLVARTGRESERAAAEALSDALGGLPLAHEQAAAYCERLEIGLADYANRFAAAPAKFLDDRKHAPAEYHDGLTVAKTFALAIEEATKLHPASKPLLVHAALLAPEPIPLFFFEEGREYFDEPLATLLTDDGIAEAVAALRAFALVDREAILDERDPKITTDTIRLHRLVRQVAVPTGLIDPRDRNFRALAAICAKCFPHNYKVSIKTQGQHSLALARARRLEPFALAATEVGEPWSADCKVSPSSTLFDFLGQYRFWLSEYVAARPLFERGLAIREKALGATHPGIADNLNLLVALLMKQDDLVAALPLAERSFQICDRFLSAGDIAWTNSYRNLCSLLYPGDLPRAKLILESAIEKCSSAKNASITEFLFPLIFIFSGKENTEKKVLLLRRAEETCRKVYGKSHGDTSIIRRTLARELRDQRGSIALPHSASEEESLTILQQLVDQVQGFDPLAAVAVRCQVASILQKQGNLVEALSLYEINMAATEKALGIFHPTTKEAARVTADALAALGEVEKAAEVRARYDV